MIVLCNKLLIIPSFRNDDKKKTVLYANFLSPRGEINKKRKGFDEKQREPDKKLVILTMLVLKVL